MTRLIFGALVLVTCLVHAVTLSRSPPAWQDEVQIIDYGRTLWPGSDQTYGVNWGTADRPLQSMCYVGCLIQEAAYRTAEGDMTGPRVGALAGAVIAAVALRSWLLAAGISPWVAVVAACGFLWDPLVVAGYRGARVDAWSMAFMFGALWCVRHSCRARHRLPSLVLAGAMAAASGLTWASAILLVPLLLYELYASAAAAAPETAEQKHRLFPAGFARSTLIVGASAAAFMVLLLVPFVGSLFTMVADLRGDVSDTIVNNHSKLVDRVWATPRLFLASPWLPLIALGGAAALGPRSWLLSIAVAFCGIAITRAYSHRAVYLMPYFAHGFAVAVDQLRLAAGFRPLSRNPATWLAVLVLTWSAAVSLVGRTVNALNEWDQRDPATADRFIHELGGDSTTTVLLDSWNLYYPIRSRGWRYWGPCDMRPTDEVASSLVYDFVIHDESAGLHPLDGSLRSAGYSRRVVSLRDAPAGVSGVSPKATSTYGPYVVYTRPASTTPPPQAE